MAPIGIHTALAVLALILAVLALFTVAAPFPLIPVAVIALAVAMLI